MPHENLIEKLVVVDAEKRCTGLITVKDMEKAKPSDGLKGCRGRLLVAAATGAGSEGLTRAEALIDAGVDAIIVDTAHGHAEAFSIPSPQFAKWQMRCR